MRTARAVTLAMLLLAACSKKTDAPAPGPAAGTAAAPFSMRDLAAATALDARLARFSLVASDVQAALPGAVVAPARTQADARDAARQRAVLLLPRVDVAYAEVARAAEGIRHAGDRAQAGPALAAAKAYAGKLAAAATGDAAALAPELLAAREALGAAISRYRAARSRWRLDAPEPEGAERDFAEARREAERAESALGARTPVAPREAGRARDGASAGAGGLEAARRAQAAADRLPNPLRGPAVLYAAAEGHAVEAVSALAQAPEGERPAIARRYHAAKADALAALADYFAALSAR